MSAVSSSKYQVSRQEDNISDRQKYGIKVSSSIIFKGKTARPGYVFFIATWDKWMDTGKAHNCQRFQEGYEIFKDNIELFGRELCEESVVQQVLMRHFPNT